MNRNNWKFQYAADKLLVATEAKLAWHEGRLKWWGGKRDELKDKIRSEGIEIDESVAFGTDNYLSNKSSHRGPVAQIRNDLLTDLNECVQKVYEHQGKTKEYDAWRQVLASQGTLTLELNQDDWLFFYGK